MKDSIKKYQRETKRRCIHFSKKDYKIYQFSKLINFNKFVKENLYTAMIEFEKEMEDDC